CGASRRERAARHPPAEESEARAEEGEAWRVHDLLPPVSPAPRDGGRRQHKSSIAELARMLAPAIALLSLSKGSGHIPVREAWDAVPEPKPRYDVLNSVGDSLGHGRGGHALQLRRCRRRGIVVCKEDVTACLRRMTDEEVRILAKELGCATREDLMTAFGSLPSAEDSADS